MESFPEMTSKVTALVRATGIDDPGRVSDAGTERPDPEVPERARRRTFTATYKAEILAAYHRKYWILVPLWMGRYIRKGLRTRTSVLVRILPAAR